MVVVAIEVGKKQKRITVDGIHVSTISLRFLGIIPEISVILWGNKI
jgi:hypothetical protein